MLSGFLGEDERAWSGCESFTSRFGGMISARVLPGATEFKTGSFEIELAAAVSLVAAVYLNFPAPLSNDGAMLTESQ